MVTLPVIPDQIYFHYEKRIQLMRILSPLSLIGLFFLTLATGQAAFFLLALPLFAYYGYVSKGLTEKKEAVENNEVLILDDTGVSLFQGKKPVWSVSRDDITELKQKNAFHPAPDTLQQFIDELNGHPYESLVTFITNEVSHTVRVHIRSFHEGNEVRRWFGKGFEVQKKNRKVKSPPRIAMSY